jgi:hypothetical protein
MQPLPAFPRAAGRTIRFLACLRCYWGSGEQWNRDPIEQRIDRIKQALLEIGAMRPGSLTRQYKDPQHHTGAYWQISYTRQMRSRTEYVRQESVKEIRRQIATHKRFKRLVDEWIDLSIEHSRLTMQIAGRGATR